MNEQTLKELGIELKKLELKENDVLIIEYDIRKIKPKELDYLVDILKKQFDNKFIGIPNDKSIRLFSCNKNKLNVLKETIDERIDDFINGEL